MRHSNEPFWWSLFSAGGVVSALCLPALVIATGLVVPVLASRDAAAAHERLLETVTFWPVRVALLGVVFLSFFHAAHRVRHILMDLGWRSTPAFLSVLCYGGAGLGAVAGAFVLFGL